MLNKYLTLHFIKVAYFWIKKKTQCHVMMNNLIGRYSLRPQDANPQKDALHFHNIQSKTFWF